MITGFADNLQVLPSIWEEVNTQLNRSGIVDAVRPLLDLLPIKRSQTIEESIPTLKSQRESLRDLTKKLVFAETAEVEGFFSYYSFTSLGFRS